MTDASKSWPPRLRAALRRRLAARGLAIPEGLTLAYRKPGWKHPGAMEARHGPSCSEMVSVHDQVVPFDGSDAHVTAFLDLAEAHALRMMRRNAREAALEAAGHDVRCPPLHALEGHPLAAHVYASVAAGLAGIDGDLQTWSGLLLGSMTVETPRGRMMVQTRSGASITAFATIPETVLQGLGGRRLGDVAPPASCGDAAVDAAVAGLVIRAARGSEWSGGRATIIELEPADVMEMAPTPSAEDGRWKAMEPKPKL